MDMTDSQSDRATNMRGFPDWLRPVVQIGKSAVLTLMVLAGTMLGQRSSSRSAVARTQILFLGTGGGPALHVDRSEPATLLMVDGRSYLIDCGIGTMRRLLEAGMASESVD